MTKALVTMYAGEHRLFAPLTLSPLWQFANRHGYEVHVVDPDAYGHQPHPCWAKLPAMAEALQQHDVAVWVDGDVFIADDSSDPADTLTADKFLAILHDVRYGICSAVYAMRRGKLAHGFLLDAWLLRWRNFPDWDQGAMAHLLAWPEYRAGVAFLEDWCGPVCSGRGLRIIHGCRETAETVPERVEVLRQLIGERVG